MRIGDFLCFAGTNFCGYGGLVFLAKHYFLGFLESTQYPALIIFSFLLSTCNRNTYFLTIKQSGQSLPYALLFLNERDKL